MKDKVSIVGFALVCASTVLSIVAAILYNFALLKNGTTYVLLVIAAVLGAAALALALKLGKEIPNIVVVVHTLVAMAALGVSIAPMVNEIALVYAGLNPQSNLTGYIVFAVFACVTWILGLVASFTGVTKKQ
ncbi:MAG: hypothetical protein IJP67_01235 [Oscillospiraceae bacterium]|nr:hypothetical protein [Oscillospiraceae bacterium]MBR0062771.1 hypothetical protein [Oscillospiraceae bacterium]